MATQVHPPRGMRDFLPVDKRARERVLRIIRGAYEHHGFEEIETPVMEDAARLHAGLGGDNEKLAFAVMRRGLTVDDLQAAEAPLELADLGLRFDLTVPLARFIATHRASLPPVFRAIQIAPVWRAERPQRGRYRQFMQCDIDIAGDAGIGAELELLAATGDALTRLGIPDAFIRINDRRILFAALEHAGVPAEQHEAALITVDKLAAARDARRHQRARRCDARCDPARGLRRRRARARARAARRERRHPARVRPHARARHGLLHRPHLRDRPPRSRVLARRRRPL